MSKDSADLPIRERSPLVSLQQGKIVLSKSDDRDRGDGSLRSSSSASNLGSVAPALGFIESA